MTALVLTGLAVLAAVAWLVLRLPSPASAPDTLATRRAQLQASLDELARARSDGVLDEASFADEQRRLQADMAALAQPAPAPSASRPDRTLWPFALAVFILLPAAAVGLYGYLQGPFWQQMDAMRDAPNAAAPVDPAAMVARLEARLAKDGSDPEGWRRLGRSYVVLGRPADARRAYDRAAQLAPDDLTLLEGYADAAEPGVAPPPGIAAMIASVEQGILATPDDPRAWVRAGFARSMQGDRTGARDAYARAHELDPQRPEVLAAYAASEYALNPQQPSARAVELYERLLKINPDNGSALWVLGQAAQRAGQPAQARDYWQRLLGLLPADSPMRAQVQRAIDTVAGGAGAP
ncbi:MAG: c-type cytochrome biogenesis protein CcmI [Immundisolibacter sp.]|uniref:c-type cytochrome biogenesis protein CcmI n=1 Tax=Immundisolibacter sp. TaxID=1934948 RepID=UPI001988CA9A|nr:c-type cytochrome biogenesis protein CcmI [Immundisolibacter sp.]MBC7163198.1 c-type cytochrome biogenesis protein CcmI [Immundisolibacter sp.]